MASVTVQQIMDDALVIIGEVAGAGVQAYGEDRLMRDVVRAFNMLFKKQWWEQYREWFSLTLDGTVGMVTTDDLENVRDFEDFAAVHRDGEANAITVLPKRINPYTLTGNRVLYWGSLGVRHTNYAKRRLKFYPATATGTLNILARVYPLTTLQDWTPDTVVDLDKDMLAYGGAFMTLASDDLNPGGAQLAKSMMEMRYNDIVKALSSHAISVEGAQSDIPLGNYFETP